MTVWERVAQNVAGLPLNVQRNATTTTITRGTPVIFDTQNPDGVGVRPCDDAARLGLFAGVAYEDVAAGAYGRFQIGGFCDYATVNSTSGAISPGDVLGLSASLAAFVKVVAADNRPGIAFAMETVTVGLTVARKVLIGHPGC